MSETTAPASTQELSEEEMRARILAVILEMAPDAANAHGPTTGLVDDLGYHSLALMEMAFALEDEFDLDPIDEESARTITTIGSVQDFVVAKVAEQAA